MDSVSDTLTLLADLESRHDELLLRLDELDRRVEKALADCQCFRIPRDQRPAARKAA